MTDQQPVKAICQELYDAFAQGFDAASLAAHLSRLESHQAAEALNDLLKLMLLNGRVPPEMALTFTSQVIEELTRLRLNPPVSH